MLENPQLPSPSVSQSVKRDYLFNTFKTLTLKESTLSKNQHHKVVGELTEFKNKRGDTTAAGRRPKRRSSSKGVDPPPTHKEKEK